MIEVAFFNELNYPVDVAALERVVAKVFLMNDQTVARVGVHIVDETRMTQLNEQYKHHQGATDVLTFVLHDPEQPTPSFLETPDSLSEFGDVFLCYEVIEAEALQEEISVQERLEFLLEHGCLHLLGIHHE
jgi:rRNA maturation RNase YbeY